MAGRDGTRGAVPRSGARALAALVLAALLLALPGTPREAAAQAGGERRALLIEGKKTLHQRVLTRPGAVLARARGDEGGTEVPPFSIFYVYARDGGPEGWIEVGRSSTGPADGWMRAEKAIDWHQSLTVAFSNPAGRERVLFLRERDDLRRLLNAEAPAIEAARLRTEVLRGLGDAGPVLALEPETYIDVTKQFYLLPILHAEQSLTEAGDPMRLLQVASVSMVGNDPTAPADRLAALRDFSAGLTFVLDTTISMDPYIARTREAVQRINDRIGNTVVAERFRFGLVTYRNSLKATPALEYVARVEHRLDEGDSPRELIEKMEGVKAATVSSSSFYEDPYAGLKLAIDQMPWERYGGRYIILITDASGRPSDDPLSTTGLGPAEIRQLAREKGIAIFVLHLQTPQGRNDHARGRAQYSELAQWPQAGALYYPVPAGDVDQFGAMVDRIANDLLMQVSQTVGSPVGGVEAPRPAAPAAPDRRLAQQAEIVGNAMRLAYLGRREGTQAPDVFRAWTLDRDVADLAKPALDVRVLLTKNQLNDLSASLKLILDNGLASRTAPDTFFRQLRAASLAASRDPRGLNRIESIGDVMGEYLDGLPYDSPVMRMTEDHWRQMGSVAQREFLNGIEAKLRLYREFNAQTDLWVSFDGGRNPGDALFPIPLEALP